MTNDRYWLFGNCSCHHYEAQFGCHCSWFYLNSLIESHLHQATIQVSGVHKEAWVVQWMMGDWVDGSVWATGWDSRRNTGPGIGQGLAQPPKSSLRHSAWSHTHLDAPNAAAWPPLDTWTDTPLPAAVCQPNFLSHWTHCWSLAHFEWRVPEPHLGTWRIFSDHYSDTVNADYVEDTGDTFC